MKKKKLRRFIFLMTFALVGLIALQFYWLEVGIDVNKKRFRQNVHDALNEVSRKLDQNEVLYVAQKNVFKSRNLDGFIQIFIDSLGEEKKDRTFVSKMLSSRKDARQETRPALSPSKKGEDLSEVRVKKQNDSSKKITLSFSSSIQEGQDEGQSINGSGSYFFNYENYQMNLETRQDASDPDIIYKIKKLEQKKQESKKNIIHIVDKYDVVDFIMDELRKESKPIRQRINKNLLDNLLKREFEHRGVNTEFEFFVESKSGQNQVNFLFQDDDQVRHKITSAGFSTQLFPTDVFGNQNILHVYFPYQRAYIYQNMAWMFASSLLFIGLIIFCLAYAVYTIIRQKKISDITNDFINNMTHELKTPISTVSLACEALQDKDIRQLSGQVDRYLNVIKEENERLGTQVEKVLQIALLDRGDYKLKLSRVNVHQVIEKALRNINIQIENREGTLIKDLQAQNTMIEADEVHLTNMIYNLLDNANKYSPDQPKIQIHTENTQEGIKISIADKGQGMARETINKVFDKFYRIPTGNIHNVKGFGLGLSYVKTMVEAHQGQVDVKSELKKGSTFTLFFPYQQVSV